MRMRRILAFALAVIMLMSNTVTASATSASSTPSAGSYTITTNEDGETVIIPADEGGEDDLSGDGTEVTPPADNENEPSGEDRGTGGEGSDGDSTGDGTDTPDGDDNNNDNLDSGEEGGDIDDPNAGEGDGEDPNAPAEGEEITTEEEETTEELATEEMLLSKLLLSETEGTTDVEGDEKQDIGEVVLLTYGDRNNYARVPDDATKLYFKTVANAVDALEDLLQENPDWTKYEMDENGSFTSSPSKLFEIILVDPTEEDTGEYSYEVSGDDLVIYAEDGTVEEIGGLCTLYMEGHTLEAVSGTVTTSMSISGGYSVITDEGTGLSEWVSSKVEVASGAVFQVLPGYADEDTIAGQTDISYVSFDYTDANGTFIVGDSGTGALENAGCVMFSRAELDSGTNLEVYDNFQYNLPDCGVNLNSVKVELDEYRNNGFCSPEKMNLFQGNFSVDTWDIIAGEVWTDTNLTIGTLKLTEETLFEIADTITVNKIETAAKAGAETGCSIRLTEVYSYESNDDGEATYTLKRRGRLNITGSVVLYDANEPIDLLRSFQNCPDGRAWKLVKDDVIGTVPAGVTADMFAVDGMTLGINESNELYVQGQNFYGVTKGYDKWGYSGTMTEFVTLEDAKEFIKNDTSGETYYWVRLLDDIEIAEDIDFSSIPDKSVGFYLGYNELNVTDSINIRAAALDNGTINIAKDETLSILSSGNTLSNNVSIVQTKFNFAEESTEGGLVFGEQGKADEINVMIRYYSDADTNTCFVNTEDLDLSVYGSVEWMGNACTGYWGGYIGEGAFDPLTIVFDTINIEHEYVEDQGYSEEFKAGVSVSANSINLEGKFEPYALDTQKLTAFTTSDIFLRAKSWIYNIDLRQSDNCDGNLLGITLVDTYDSETAEVIAEADVTFGGTFVNANSTRISFGKIANDLFNENRNNCWIEYNESKSVFELNEKVATVDVSSGNAGIQSENNYGIYAQKGVPFYLDWRATESPYTYELYAMEDATEIYVEGSDGSGRGFKTLELAKAYIEGRNKEDVTYKISLNEDFTVSGNELYYDYDSECREGVELYLNNHIITFTSDSTVKLDRVYGDKEHNPNSKLDIGKYTVTFLPRLQWPDRGDKKECGIQDLKIVSNSTTPGSIVLGDANDIINSEVHVSAVSFTNKLKNLTLYGQVFFFNDSTLTVTDTIYVENQTDEENDIHQSARLDGWVITVKTLNARKGQIEIGAIDVTGNSYFTAGRCVTILPICWAELNNIIIDANADDPYMPLNVDFRTEVQLDDIPLEELNGDIDPASVGEKLDYGHLTINGTITTNGTMYNPIGVNRFWYSEWNWLEDCEYTDPDTGETSIVEKLRQSHVDEQEPFEGGEVILVATNAATTAKYFSIQGDGTCTKKVGNNIVADRMCLEVIYDGEPRMSAIYTSLEDAVANMPTDFGKAEGDYTFVFFENAMLSKDITIPSFVKRLNLATGEHGEDVPATDNPEYDAETNPITKWQGYGTYYRRYLDLNGKKLTTSALVNLSEGLRINSWGPNEEKPTVRGQLVITAVSDGEPVLNIDEDKILVDYDEDGNLYELNRGERDVVLRNVLVTAKSGNVRLWVTNKNLAENEGEALEYSEEKDDWWYTLDASFDVKSFGVDGGYWNIGEYRYDEEKEINIPTSGLVTADGVEEHYIKAANIRLNGNGHSEWLWNEETEQNDIFNVGIDADTQLLVPDLTVTGGYAESRGRLEVCDSLDLVKCRFDVLEGAELRAEDIDMSEAKLAINEAYVNVYDELSVSKAYAGESAGDYTVENRGQLSVADVSMPVGTFANYEIVEAQTFSVKDYVGEDDAHLLCNTFKNTGAAKFGWNSNVLIHESGTVNNIYIYQYDGDDGQALLGRASGAEVTLTGKFTKENENQKLAVYVSDSFADFWGNEESNPDNEEEKWYVWDYIDLWDDENEIDDNMKVLERGTEMFKTTISAFPVENIRVRPWQYWDGENKVDNINNAVYQEGNSLKVTGEYINIHAELPNGDWSHLKGFTNWKDASAYLNTLNSKTTTYIVEIREDINLGQKLDLPANVKQIVFCSGKGEEVEKVWYPEKIRLSFQGDITLKTDTSFENIILDTYTLDKQKNPVEDYQPTIDTKGKRLDLRSVEFEDGGIKALKGTSTSYVHIVDTDVAIASKVSGIHEMVLTHGVDLIVSGGLSVNNLIIDKFWDREEAPDPCSIRVNGSSSTLEVKKLLEMRGQTSLICDGKMKFADVLTHVEGNLFSTAGDESITITGVVGTDDMAMQYLEAYYQEITDPEYGTFNLLRGFVKTEEETDYQVVKNAIRILAGTTPNGETPEGNTVVIAEKVSPIWFAIQNPGYYEAEGINVAYANLVHKVNKNHISGLADPKDTDILLYAVFGESQMYLNSFGTLQAAFTEIDKIGGPDISFKIEVTADDDAPVVKGKLGNYTFPSKAAEVQIVGNPSQKDQNGIITLNYNNALTLKSNVVLENIELNPFTTNTISLGSYDAVLDNVILNDYLKTSINGSGTNKGSFLSIVGNTPVCISGDVTNVETFVIGGTEVQVDGKISAGSLVLPEDEVLTCLGTIAIGDVYTESGTIQTIPVYTWNKAKTEITKVSSNLTILGDILEMPSEDEGVEPQLTITFAEVNNGEITGVVDLEDETLNGLIGLIDADGAGITIAKAVNVDTDAIVFGNALVELDENEEPSTIGTIYKKAGTLVYKCSDPVVLLQYVDNSGSEVETLCESFADAVTEINNLKTKRDYTMGIYDLAFNAGTLTMPNAKYVDTLTICPMDCVRAEIQYMNNITFTSNVVLENIDFVQIVKNGKYEDGSTKYEPVDEVKVAPNAYPSAVSVSVAGAYFVSIVNDLDKNLVNNIVTFNTPITLNGNKKAILNIGKGGTLQTLDVGSNFEPWAEKTSLVQGKITGFAEMNVFSPISLYGYSSLNSKKEETYNATELNVTNLNVSNGASIVVGQDALNSGDKITVTNLNLTDGTLETSGTGTFTNVVLGEGTDTLAVYGQTFNINGNLTSLTSDAELVTGLSKKSEAALYIKGNVVLGDAATDIICVKVTEDAEVGVRPYILGQVIDEEVKNSTLLLKAKTAPIDVFRPSTEDEESCVLEDNEYNPAAPDQGYILKKTGENIQVCYGSEIGVALCGPAAENGAITEVINYYPTYNDAVAAIEALKDTTAEYTIVVIQPVGTEESPVALSMPSKAAKVTVVGYVGNAENEAIYYTNAPSLKTDMVFANVTLAPEKVSKKVVSPAKLGITTGNFDITLQDIEVTGANAGIAKITGKNTATIKLDSEGVVINGDISAAKEVIVAKNARVTGNVTADLVTLESGKTVTVDSKFTAKELKLNGTSVVDAQKAAVTITDIASVGDNNKIVYGQDANSNSLLTIKGNVENASSPVILDMQAANLKTLDTITNPAKISLVKEAKLATVEKESLDKMNFALKGATFNSSDYCWANKGVYRVSEAFAPIQIKDEQDNVITYCLDFAQAVNYINTAADIAQDYVINLAYTGAYVDVNLTDDKAAGKSAITMPGKDKAESVKVLGLNNGGTKIAFSGNITTYGDVIFENIWLLNDNASNFTIANKKDSDKDSSLTLIDTAANGKAVIKSISGEKGITDITIRIEEGGIYPSESYGAISNAELVDISNSANVITFTGMSTVDNFTIAKSKVQTTGKATVGTLNLQTNAAWEAKAAATVTTIAEAKAGSYIGTFHSLDKNSVSTGLPQFTVTGNVAEPVQVKLFNSKVTDANGEWLEIREAAGAEGFATLNAKVKYATDYANQKLVLAKAESADKFIAAEYVEWNGNVFTFTNPGSVQAYKDKNGYVSNGNINAMEVLLSELDGNGAEIEGTKTYVATYAEAIQVINNLNNKDASYKILLRKTEGNEGVIKTALSGTTSVYGTLALPAAKKAASITIVGETDDMVMKYTSGLKPNCDVTFNNITLTEGSLDKKGNYTALNYITPNLDAEVTLTFAGNVKTLDAEDVNLVFNKISGKKGEIAFAANYDIESKGAISIADISGGDNVTINIHTYFTNKAWKKAATQLSINGDVQLGEGSIINVIPHVYDAATKTYDVISDAQMAEMLISSSATPASWQKVITAPKMQTMNGKITLCGKEDVAPVKYNGGVYFTSEELPVVLHGGEPEVVPDGEGGYDVKYEDDYVAYFLSWEEAIKEIDRINVKKIYTIELYGDLGTETPIKTLTMPSKASGLIVLGISDANNESPDIMMTGTTITAKCHIAFDNVGITAVKKTGNNYYSVPFTLNTGNFEVEIENMPDMCRFFVDNGEWIEERGQYDSEMKVTGSAKGSFIYTPCEVWYDADRSGFIPKTENDVTRIVGGPDNYVDVISQISKVGNVILNTGDIVAARWDEEGNLVGDPIYAAYHDTYYYIPNGISGVNSFMITPDVRVDCAKTDFAVKDLMIGDTADEYDENDILIENADERSGLSARNITVSGLLTMASSDMHAGTSAVGDGKVTLTNVIFRDNHNHIEGKQDKNGNSLIQIKGTVGAYNDDMRICDSAVTIGLFYNNSSQNYVRVSEGMNLLTAPKAASSWFRPNYGWENKETGERADNMGWEIGVDRTKKNDDGTPMFKVEEEKTVPDTEFVPIYGLYKSGNNIKYGQIREAYEYEYTDESSVKWILTEVDDSAEVRLWIGTDTPAWDAGQSAYLDFMTFEEAVKAIDSMGLKAADGTNLNYCIELLRTVEIGNAAGNGKYSALSLPAKASKVTICGNDNSLLFTGNVTLKCNTEFLDVKLSPVKLVKGEVIPAEVNLAAGNFELKWSPGSRVVYAYEDNGEWHYDEGYAEDQVVGYTFANVTGSSKGKLILTEDSELSANNVTGFGEIIFEGDEPEDGYSWIYTKNNVSVTKVTYKQYTEAKLRVCGNLTVTSVTLEDDVDAQFRVFTGKTLKVNGTTLKDENGVKYNESVDNGDTDETLKLYLYDQTGTYAAGTKLVTGKYLDASEWTVYTTDEVPYTYYTDAAGTGLYLGKVAAAG